MLSVPPAVMSQGAWRHVTLTRIAFFCLKGKPFAPPPGFLGVPGGVLCRGAGRHVPLTGIAFFCWKGFFLPAPASVRSEEMVLPPAPPAPPEPVTPGVPVVPPAPAAPD